MKISIITTIMILVNFNKYFECNPAVDQDLTVSGFEEFENKKFRQFAKYVTLMTEDNDATVDRHNTPTYPTVMTCSLFMEKLMASTNVLVPSAYLTHFMVNNLITDGHLKSKRVETAMRSVDKEDFAPMNPLNKTHYDYPIDIGYGTWMEPPYQIAGTLEYLKRWISPSSKILEIGAGTGYMSALLGTMNPKKIYAVEHVPELAKKIKQNLKQGAPNVYVLEKVKVICADGRNGYPEEAPYDVIYVSASFPDVPWNITDQLKVGGRMIYSTWRDNIEEKKNTLVVFNKYANGTEEEDLIHTSIYLPPLTDLHKQLKSNLYDGTRTYKPWMWHTADYENECYFDKKSKEKRNFSCEYYTSYEFPSGYEQECGVRSPLWWNEPDESD